MIYDSRPLRHQRQPSANALGFFVGLDEPSSLERGRNGKKARTTEGRGLPMVARTLAGGPEIATAAGRRNLVRRTYGEDEIGTQSSPQGPHESIFPHRPNCIILRNTYIWAKETDKTMDRRKCGRIGRGPVVLAVCMLAVACRRHKPDVKPVVPEGTVDLGLVLTRADGTTYNLYWADITSCFP